MTENLKTILTFVVIGVLAISIGFGMSKVTNKYIEHSKHEYYCNKVHRVSTTIPFFDDPEFTSDQGFFFAMEYKDEFLLFDYHKNRGLNLWGYYHGGRTPLVTFQYIRDFTTLVEIIKYVQSEEILTYRQAIRYNDCDHNNYFCYGDSNIITCMGIGEFWEYNIDIYEKTQR